MILRTERYRLYPTKAQEEILLLHFELARLTYNHQLGFKIQAFQKEGKSLSQFDLNNHLVELKKNHPALKQMHSQVLQNINQRVAWAFQHFFRRVKKKENPGFPRFKGKNRYDSLTYPQSGFALDQKLLVSKIGNINIVKHREVRGRIKTLTLKREPSGKWYAFLSVEKEPLLKAGKTKGGVALDLGLIHYYADSEGKFLENPRYLRKSERKLVQVQRKHSKKKKGSKNRQKSHLKLARRYEKIANQRSDFLHKESRKLVNIFSTIMIEKLSIQNMLKNRYLSKSISDAAWQKFQHMLAYKAEEAGSKILEVDARGTSQYCICGNRVEKILAVRIHRCNTCGLETDRDTMSAMLIQQIAVQGATVGRTGSNARGDERMLSSRNQELSKVIS